MNGKEKTQETETAPPSPSPHLQLVVHGKGTPQVTGGEDGEGHAVEGDPLVVPHDATGLALGLVALLQAARVTARVRKRVKQGETVG